MVITLYYGLDLLSNSRAVHSLHTPSITVNHSTYMATMGTLTQQQADASVAE